MDAAVESVGLLVPFVCRDTGLVISLLLARFLLEAGVWESWVESGCDCGVADAGAARRPLMEAMANVALLSLRPILFRCWVLGAGAVVFARAARLLGEVDVQCDKRMEFPVTWSAQKEMVAARQLRQELRLKAGPRKPG